MGRMSRSGELMCVSLVRRALGGTEVLTQHTFDFLRGDPTQRLPRGRRLPVDAFFPAFNLVIEYMGPQHFRPVPFMDRRPGRSKQRDVYQQRRTEVLARQGVKLLRFRFDEPLDMVHVTKRLAEVGITFGGRDV